MNRKEIALQRIDITKGSGLELGPLYSPIVLKDEAEIYYLDHMSTEDLKKKYTGHPFNVDEIVPVDYVLKNNSLKESVKGKKFDYVIGSHVIEHIPDTISWFADIASVLKNDGILSLVIPDKRFTFDILRNESRPGDVIGAYLDKHTKANSATIYDYVTKFRENVVASEVWSNPHKEHGKKTKSKSKEAYDACLRNLEPDNYVDSHCFVFTPYSFFEIIRTLIGHNLFDYEIAYFKDTPENQLEFYVSLRKSKKSTPAQKLKSVPKLPKTDILSDLEAEISRLKTEFLNVTSSKSWKVTKPLRAGNSIASKLKKKMKGQDAYETS